MVGRICCHHEYWSNLTKTTDKCSISKDKDTL